MKKYFEILGIDEPATADEVKKAFRRLAKKYHPDRNDATDAELKFIIIRDAYEKILKHLDPSIQAIDLELYDPFTGEKLDLDLDEKEQLTAIMEQLPFFLKHFDAIMATELSEDDLMFVANDLNEELDFSQKVFARKAHKFIEVKQKELIELHLLKIRN